MSVEILFFLFLFDETGNELLLALSEHFLFFGFLCLLLLFLFELVVLHKI